MTRSLALFLISLTMATSLVVAEEPSGNIEDLLGQGKRAIEHDDYTKAGDCLSRILQLSGNKSSDPRVTAFGSVVLAYGTWQQHPDQVSLAQKNLESAITQDPAWAYPYYFLARILSYSNSLDQAVPFTEKALIIDPALAKAEDFAFLSIMYNRRQEHDRAVRMAQQGTERFPTDPMGHLALAEAFLSGKDPLMGFYELQYAVFLGGSGNPAFLKAKQDLKELIAQYRNEPGRQQQPELFACLEAFRLQSESRFSESILLFQQALSLRATPHPLVHLFLGEAYLQDNQLEAGIRELKLVAAAITWFAPSYAELGDAYEMLKDYESAKGWWNRSIVVDPINWKSQQAKASVERLAKKSKAL